jgi:hypothetical protein
MIFETNVGPENWSKQPDPIKNDHPAIWDLVLQDIERATFNHPTQEKMHHLLVEHIKLRDKIGEQKYGVRLQPFNGREALQDAYEEFLDSIVYLRQALYEETYDNVLVTPESEFFRVGITQIYAMSLNAALRLCYMIEKRKEINSTVKENNE